MVATDVTLPAGGKHVYRVQVEAVVRADTADACATPDKPGKPGSRTGPPAPLTPGARVTRRRSRRRAPT